MPSGSRCPDCGSSELVEDSHYSQSQLVCSDCGCVVTEGVLTTTFNDEGNLRGTLGVAWCAGMLNPRLLAPHPPIVLTQMWEKLA